MARHRGHSRQSRLFPGIRACVDGGAIYAVRLPGLRTLIVFTPRSQPRVQLLGEFFDGVEVFGGRYWVLGGSDLEPGVDDVELVDDSRGIHHALVRGRSWIAVMSAHWTGDVEIRCLAGGALVDTDHMDEVERFIDSGWTSYAPLDTRASD